MNAAQPAAERAYEHTKRAILDNAIPAGHLLAEGDIAQELSISRTPVREAFLRLQSEGLLKLYPRRGALVVPITPQESDALFELRGVFESFAARKVMAAGEPEFTEFITELRAQLEGQNAHPVGDLRGFVELDRRFHATIVGAAGNFLIDELYESVRDKQLRLGLDGLRNHEARLDSILREHDELVRRLAQRDIDGYEACLAGHLDASRQALS
jgi:DNA-binding GntR family transcriptional regulator